MSKYNLSPSEEALARELYFDLGYDNYSTLETYLRSNQSNRDVENYGPVRKKKAKGGKVKKKKSVGKVHRGRKAAYNGG
tara:strand:+ start:878 stop:1114 length:237 start_codon:yes stop_codon:yes gene_type:complete